MSFDTASSLQLIDEALSLTDRLGAQTIETRKVLMSDRTLVVEIVAGSEDPVRLRGEIANVMGVLSGLDIRVLFPALQVQSLGVRAFDSSGNELLWIVSSLAAAEFAAKGQPVEWLSRSLVQENTGSYRRSQVDRRIGQVETALREVMDHHASPLVGKSYIQQLWPSEVRKMRAQARAEGEDADDSRCLLDYAFLPQLRDAILDHPQWFDDGCISSGFGQAITVLNKVRRKVAHHRAISDDDVRSCRDATDVVLTPLGRAHPYLISDFVVDRWEERIAEILAITQQTVQGQPTGGSSNSSEAERRKEAVNALQAQLAGIESAIGALQALVVPAQRRDLHHAAASALIRWKKALEDLLSVARRPDLSSLEAQAAHDAYEAALVKVRELYGQIRAIRLGMPANGSNA